jgi:hypothetical protein
MGFGAKILADSFSQAGDRLTTFEITFPRIILAEFNTHRVISRNSASSRAIPVKTMLRMVDADPYVPTHWGRNQKGMSAEQELTADEQELAKRQWLLARDSAVAHAKMMLELGLHKQMTNRLLEPFMWHTVICTATEWSNYFHLRDNAAAHPEIQRVARAMRELFEVSKPMPLNDGEWHLPLVLGQELMRVGEQWWLHESDPPVPVAPDEIHWEQWAKISVARCGRVSYLTHDGLRDIGEDLTLHDKLLSAGHMSPLEHAARPIRTVDVKCRSVYFKDGSSWCGNFRGWMQHRGMVPHEDDRFGHQAT